MINNHPDILPRLNNRFLILTISIFSIVLIFTPLNFLLLYTLHLYSALFFYLTINQCLKQSDEFYTKTRLIIIVSAYTFLFVSINNSVSYYYNNNFFIFSEMDAAYMHELSSKMAKMPFSQSILYFLTFHSFDDIGVAIITSSLYRIIPSNLFLNFLYCIFGIITASGIFRISKSFISKKYSFICALAFCTSSFMVFFHSSGLKETVMVMLVVLVFDQFYLYIKQRKIVNLVLALALTFSLIFFRIAVGYFCFLSISLGLLFLNTMSGKKIFWMVFIGSFFYLAILFVQNNISQSYLDRFIGNGFEAMIEGKKSTGMVIGGVFFTYIINAIATFFGHLPTVIIKDEPLQSFYSSGLVFRCLLMLPFWCGIFIIIKKKLKIFYPLIIFTFLEMFSLLYIIESLELRKSLPHIAFLYIISFWFLDTLNENEFFSKNGFVRINNLMFYYTFFIGILILGWNLRSFLV